MQLLCSGLAMHACAMDVPGVASTCPHHLHRGNTQSAFRACAVDNSRSGQPCTFMRCGDHQQTGASEGALVLTGASGGGTSNAVALVILHWSYCTYSVRLGQSSVQRAVSECKQEGLWTCMHVQCTLCMHECIQACVHPYGRRHISVLTSDRYAGA